MLKTAAFEDLTNDDLRGLIGTVISGVLSATDGNQNETVRFAGTVLSIQIAESNRRVGIDMVGSSSDGNVVSWDRDEYEVHVSWDE